MHVTSNVCKINSAYDQQFTKEDRRYQKCNQKTKNQRRVDNSNDQKKKNEMTNYDP